MIALGLLLILIAIGATLFAVTAPSAATATIVVTALGVKVSASPLAMFLAGATSVVLIGVGWFLISSGTRRRASSRRELRDLRKAQAASDASAPAEVSQRSSRRDHQGKDTATGTSNDKADKADRADKATEGTESAAAAEPERQPHAEPPAPS